MFNFKKTTINQIEYIDSSKTEWDNDAIIFQIRSGKGIISSKTYVNDNIIQQDLCINERSLFSIQSDNYNCPTCQNIIEEGYGFLDKDRIITNQIVEAQKNSSNLYESLENLKPLLELFSSGLYMLTRIKMYPTDGEGNFFWNSTNKKRLYNATADIIYKCYCGSSYMRYLYPSEPISKLDEDKVYEYASKNNSNTCLVYYINGAIGLIMDGHHRASSACLNNEVLDALCLTRIEGYGSIIYNDITNFWAFGSKFELETFENKNILEKSLRKVYSENKITFSLYREQRISDVKNEKKILKELSDCAKKYPTYNELAFDNYIEEISFERLEYLWNKYDEDSLFEFEILMSALFRKNKKEFFQYIIKIINDVNKSEHWRQAFNYLLTYPYSDIEEIIVNFLVYIDYDKSNPIKKLIDEYLRKV